ncbi:MAG: presqualene diphosphate synthase HpnD [Dongiaceae bacterium]
MSEQAAGSVTQAADARHHVADVVVQAKTSFYWAMRLLPADKRHAMFAVYAFCRVVDDVADGELPPSAKLDSLQAWREEIDRLFDGRPRHAITRALATPARLFNLAQEDFLAIVDGMEMDARDKIVAPTMADLELYCSRVAGAVGRLSVRIFGIERAAGLRLSRALGQAVQLTNILRDLAEDGGLGRLYLPRELLERHGVPSSTPAAALGHPNLPGVCDALALIAERDFTEAGILLRGLPRGPARPAIIIHAVYHGLLGKLRQRGFTDTAERVSLSKAEKLWYVLRHGIL